MRIKRTSEYLYDMSKRIEASLRSKGLPKNALRFEVVRFYRVMNHIEENYRHLPNTSRD